MPLCCRRETFALPHQCKILPILTLDDNSALWYSFLQFKVKISLSEVCVLCHDIVPGIQSSKVFKDFSSLHELFFRFLCDSVASFPFTILHRSHSMHEIRVIHQMQRFHKRNVLPTPESSWQHHPLADEVVSFSWQQGFPSRKNQTMDGF